METVRLRNIQHPAQVEKLLHSLVMRGSLAPKDCHQIRDPAALPPQLKAVAAKAVEEGRVWACWVDTHETRLFTCEMSLPLSRERGTPVLLVNLYDEGGELKDAGTWMSDPDGKWQRFAD